MIIFFLGIHMPTPGAVRTWPKPVSCKICGPILVFWTTFWTPDPFNSKRKLQNMWSVFSVLDLFLDLRSFQLKAEGAKYVSQNMEKLAQNWYFWSKTQGGNACSNTHFPFVKRSQKLLLLLQTTDRQTSDEHGFLRPSYTIAPSGQLDYTFRTAGVVPQQQHVFNMTVYYCTGMENIMRI